MKKLLFAFLLCLTSVAHADRYYEKTTIKSPTGLARTFDAVTYGAKCDGTTDDHAAWQSAWDAMIAYSYQTGTLLAAKLVGCGSGQSLITTTLNFTGLSSFSQPYGLGVTVDMTGTCLLGQTSGTPVIDMVASRFINFEHLCIYGSQTNTPSIGLMLGRSTAAHAADSHYFNRPAISGYFTLADWVNFGAEDLTIVEPTFFNSQASGATYAMIQDGLNHFDVCAKTVATGCTLPLDTNQSFGNNIVIGGWIGGVPANGTPLWIGSASHHQFYGGYMSSSGDSCVVLYNIGANQISNMYFDLHCETTALNDTFLISGTNLTPFFINLYFNDRLDSASNSTFKLDTGITLATCDGCTIKISQFNLGASIKLFDDSTKWNYGGEIYLPATGNYTVPNKFSGIVCIALTCDNYKNMGASVTNTAVGNGSMAAWTTGLNSTAVGSQACALNATGNQCVAFGGNACSAATATAACAAFGFDAAQYVSTGLSNTAMGNLALTGIAGTKITGASNTAMGYGAGTACQGACNANTLIGATTGVLITTGGSNTILGNATGSTVLTTGTHNILIGTSNATTTPANNSSHMINIGGLLSWNKASLAVPVISTCGGVNGTVDSHANSASGTVTVGSTGTVCTATFASAYTTWNHCRVTFQTGGDNSAYTYSLSAITVTATAAGHVWDYTCDGY